VSLEHEIAAIELRAREARKGLIDRLVKRRNRIAAYRALFVGEDGVIRPEAVPVLADLAATARIGFADDATMTNDQLRDRAAKRAIVLHLFACIDLDGHQLADLGRKIRDHQP